jgi:uncharacterized delta-60 repeat protein
VAVMVGVAPGEAWAADGDLDSAFGANGVVLTDFGANEHAVAVAVQRDGKIVAVGSATNFMDFGLVRYNQDGSLDSTFGSGGSVVSDFGTPNDQAGGVALQHDGKIVVAGSSDSDAVVARYNVDGKLDPSFGPRVVTDGLPGAFHAHSVALVSDGRIVVAGSFAPEGSSLFSHLFVMRLLPDGSFDGSFGLDGIVTTAGASGGRVALQGDGKIVVAGGKQTSFDGCAPWDPCDMAIVVVRYNHDGSIDSSFGTDGMVTTGRSNETNETNAIAVQLDGKIVVAGARPAPLVKPVVVSDFVVVRFNVDGTLDASFGIGGEVVTDFGAFDFAQSVELQVDGKMVVAGGGRSDDPEAATDFAIARYDADGRLDPLFGDGGKVLVDVGGSDSAQALAIQSDGNIVAAGYGGSQLADFVVMRLLGTRPLPSDNVGLVNPSTGWWSPRDGWFAVTGFSYGNPGDVPFVGDWDGDGVETPGLYRQSDGYVYLRNSNTQGIADIKFHFGNPGDVPLAGDFDGDGFHTVSIYRPSEQRFYIINALGENDGGLGAAEYSFLFGDPGDQPVVGDWDGDGVDEIGLHRASTGLFYYRNTLTTGIADGEFYFGNPGDRFVAGDWGTLDGRDTPAVFRPSNRMFYFRHTLTQGNADSQFIWFYVPADLIPIAGAFGTP